MKKLLYIILSLAVFIAFLVVTVRGVDKEITYNELNNEPYVQALESLQN